MAVHALKSPCFKLTFMSVACISLLAWGPSQSQTVPSSSTPPASTPVTATPPAPSATPFLALLASVVFTAVKWAVPSWLNLGK